MSYNEKLYGYFLQRKPNCCLVMSIGYLQTFKVREKVLKAYVKCKIYILDRSLYFNIVYCTMYNYNAYCIMYMHITSVMYTVYCIGRKTKS